MAVDKYYLDGNGLGRLISKLAEKIRNKTSGTITIVEETEDGVTTKTVQNPDNFPTIGSIVTFLNNRAKLKINQQNSNSSNQGYSVQDNINEYNGEEELQIKLGIATSTEIDNLSSNELKYIDLNGLSYHTDRERNYIDKKDTSIKIANDQINGHNTLIITDGEYNPATDIATNTLVKVNIDEDTINFINVAGKYTSEEASAYNTEHASDPDFVPVQEGDDKPADYRLAVNQQQLEQYIGSYAIDVSNPVNKEKTISLVLGTNENILYIDNSGLKTGLNLVKLTTNLDQLYGVNVKEAYVLQDNNSQPIGDPILVYKDETLLNVELVTPTKYIYQVHTNGNALDGQGDLFITTEKNNQLIVTILSNTESSGNIQAGQQYLIKSPTLTTNSTYNLYDLQGVSVSKTITIGQSRIEGQAFKYTYVIADGSQSIVYLDASQLVIESEFGDGLQTNNSGVVSIKIDQASELDSISQNFLVVTSNGLKVQGIKSEILTKIDSLGTATADTGKYIKSVGINTTNHTLEVKDQGIIPEINTSVNNTINSTAVTTKTDYSTLNISQGANGYVFSHNIKVISPSNAVEEVLYTATDAEVIAGTKQVGDVKTPQVNGLVTALDVSNSIDALSIPLTGNNSIASLFPSSGN